MLVHLTHKDLQKVRMGCNGPSNAQPPRKALVIGMSKYPKKPLASATNDAREMGNRFTQLAGFEVTLLENPNRAGHELVWQDQHYMMCTNFEDSGYNTVCDAAGVSINAAIRTMSLCVPEGVVIALLDTCRMYQTMSAVGLIREPAADAKDNCRINVHTLDGDVLLGYSCARAIEAQDGNNGHGLYTKQALERIFDAKYDNILVALGATNKAVRSNSDSNQWPQLECYDPTPFTNIRMVKSKPAPVHPQSVQPEAEVDTCPSSTAGGPTSSVGAYPAAADSNKNPPRAIGSSSPTPATAPCLSPVVAAPRAGSETLVSVLAAGTGLALASAGSDLVPGAVGDGEAANTPAGPGLVVTGLTNSPGKAALYFEAFQKLGSTGHRLLRELEGFESDKASGVTADIVNNNLQHLVGTFPGPKDTPYEGGVLKVDIQLGSDYPYKPPKMKFITRVWHPNVGSQTGEIGVDILRDQWSPAITLKTALLSLQALLESPQPDVPKDEAVAKMYLTDRAAFNEMAKTWTTLPSLQVTTENGADDAEKIQRMVDMGFGRTEALHALQVTGGDEIVALERLLSS